MPTLEAGAVIGVPCVVKPGPFSGERLISFDTVSGPISGFVRESELKIVGEEEWYVRAVVQSVTDEEIEVRIRGSFFTTNGFATIPRQMAYAA